MREASRGELACLGEDTLAAFAEGQLDEVSQERIEEHLADCQDCRVVLTRAAGAMASYTQPFTSASAESPPDEQPVPAGTRVGRYVIQSPIGRGAMGAVYLANDPDLDRKVAVKLLRANTWSNAARRQMRGRLLREAQAMARLSHPEVITVYDVGAFGEQLFVAMEYVEGHTLRGWRAAQHRTLAQMLEVYERAGSGLAAAHEAGLVHRDFKPDNVLVGRDGRVRVTDFGLARTVDTADAPIGPPTVGAESSAGDGLTVTLTRNGTLLGTPGYMAPEQLRGGMADARSDVFSFCVALYEAVYAERPFAGSSVVALQSAIERGELRAPPITRRVPTWLRSVLLRGLRASPDERYASMRALLDALRAAHAAAHRRKWVLAGVVSLLVGTTAVTAAFRSASHGAFAVPTEESFPHASPTHAPLTGAPPTNIASAVPLRPESDDPTASSPPVAPTRPPSSPSPVGPEATTAAEHHAPSAPRHLHVTAPSTSTGSPLVGRNGALILE